MKESPVTSHQPVKGPRIKKGLVIVNTGNGKGKTSAAMGVLFRAWGRDMRVIMLQFIKHTGARFGEQRAAKKIGVDMLAYGDGVHLAVQGHGQNGSHGPGAVGSLQKRR